MTMIDLLLRGVAPATRDALAAECRPDTFAPGADLLAWGQHPDRLHHILSGRAKIWRPGADGGAVVLSFLAAGDAAGLIATCRGRPAAATITAVAPTETRSWPASLFRRLLRDDGQMALNALDIVGGLATLFAERLQDLASGRADQQIARALLRLAGEDGDWSDAGATVPVTRQDLADMTRSTLHTASRTLSGWEARHWVRSTRGRVTITDPAALAEVAGLDDGAAAA